MHLVIYSIDGEDWDLYTVRYLEELVIVVTACCLHNFCAWQSDNIIENEEEQNLQDIEEEYPPTNSSDVLHTNDGQAKRLSYIDMIG